MSAEQGRHEGEMRILQAELQEERAESLRLRRQMADREAKMTQVIKEIDEERNEAVKATEATAREVRDPIIQSYRLIIIMSFAECFIT